MMSRKGILVLFWLTAAGLAMAGCGESGAAADAETSGIADIPDTAETSENEGAATSSEEQGDPEADTENVSLSDGIYSAEVVLSGGSGRASVDSPCEVTVEDGKITAEICWSSPYYDYMIVDGEKYDPVNTEGDSRFVIPVIFDEDMAVQADTTAMSQPHLIDYTLHFTLGAADAGAGAESREETGQSGTGSAEQEEDTAPAAEGSIADMQPPEIDGLTYEYEMEKQFAEDFGVYYYTGGYKVLMTASGRQYLLVPEDGAVPETLPEDMHVLQAPADRIYLAASSAMALFHAMDAMDCIAFSGTDADGWYIEDAAEAMRDGRITFAGKYSQPDYEGLLAGGCDLAVESTMILHTPEVMEKLESLGVPVLIDESSHEAHPLGRTEWIRFYGALLDREEEADAFFETQAEIIREAEGNEKTGKTVAFFFINSAGNAVVRRADDYIPEMIRLAGGEYALDDLKAPETGNSGSVPLSIEEFYAQAKDSDYLIYNASIESPLTALADLQDKSAVFNDFRAVQEGHVYTTDKYLYQATDIVGELIRDIHVMLTDSRDSDMLFLRRVE